MTPAGLRSLFRHHRASSGVAQANAHRFRHTFASDMIRAGVSLPALMRLMGHAHTERAQTHPHHTTLHSAHASGRIRRVCACGGSTHARGAKSAVMKRPSNPLSEALQARVRLLETTLAPGTITGYRHTLRLFISFLHSQFPEIRQPAQLSRDPHMLVWIEHLWMMRVHGSGPPLRQHTWAAPLIRLRKLLDLLADHAHPPKPGLLWSEDTLACATAFPSPISSCHARSRRSRTRRFRLHCGSVTICCRTPCC